MLWLLYLIYLHPRRLGTG